jgi:iduronate 2-sulfatase
MTTRTLHWLCSITVLASLTGSATAATKKKSRPNILFIISDDLNNRLGTYGDPQVKSPNIDRLAARGVRFDRAYAQYPLCNPTRTSMLTGMRPSTTTVVNNQGEFRKTLPDAVTLPQLFKNNGYFVARSGKVFHVEGNKDPGKRKVDDPLSWEKVLEIPKSEAKAHPELIKNPANREGLGLHYLEYPGADSELTDGKNIRHGIQLLEDSQKDPQGRPFMIFMGLHHPHVPFIAPKKYYDLYPLETITVPKITADSALNIPPAALSSTKPWPNYGANELEARLGKRAYFASISYMDAQVGLILDALERLKLADDTIVVFWGDHGFQLGEHGLWAKQTLFEESIRVPLIFAGPGIARHQGSPRMIEVLDIYPTLTDLAGLKAPRTVAGKSLRPLLVNPKAAWNRPAFSQYTSGRSVRLDNWHYVEWNGGKGGAQLFDQQKDPQELKNLALDPKSQATVQRLKALLRRNWPETAG